MKTSRVREQDNEVQAHGTTPHYLVEKIVRLKIYDSPYWKEQCFGLTASTLAERAAKIRYACGTFGGTRQPSKFLCLLLKMLLILPEQEIVVAYLENSSLKYLTLLAAVYIRLVCPSQFVYENLEPFLNDFRKIRIREADGAFKVSHIDEFIDSLLTKSFFMDLSLPRLTQRSALEAAGKLNPRESALFKLDPELAASLSSSSSTSNRKRKHE
jgi:pre-mRNA-splicing factor 38A